MKKWKKDDHVVIYFITRYGFSFMGNVDMVSRYLNTTPSSVIKSISNFNHLHGLQGQLGDVKSLQVITFEECSKMSYTELYTREKTILNFDDIQRKELLLKKGVKNYKFIGSRVCS